MKVSTANFYAKLFESNQSFHPPADLVLSIGLFRSGKAILFITILTFPFHTVLFAIFLLSLSPPTCIIIQKPIDAPIISFYFSFLTPSPPVTARGAFFYPLI